MRSGFLLGWVFMAATVVSVYFGGETGEGWLPSFPVTMAAVLLAVGAIAHAVIVRAAAWMEVAGAVHAFQQAGAAMVMISLFIVWGAFWLADLGDAQFAFVLLAVPVVAAGFAISVTVDARLSSSFVRCGWWLLVVLVFVTAPRTATTVTVETWYRVHWPVVRWVPPPSAYIPVALGCIAAALAVASRRLPLARPVVNTPLVSRVLFVTASGGLVGLASVWPLFVARAYGGGCSGFSNAFESTLLATSLALHGAGPFAIAALLDDAP